jgi:hypothetical protein
MYRLAALLTLTTTACSFMTIQGPPAVDPGYRPVPCTEQPVGLAIDVYAGGTLALTTASLGLAYLMLPPGEPDDPSTDYWDESEDLSRDGLLLPTVLVGVASLAFLYSAYDGWGKVQRCRQMNAMPPSRPYAPPVVRY